MAVLETLYLLLKLDSTELKKGAQEAKKTTDDVQKSFVGLDDSSKKVSTAFSDIALSLGAFVAGFFTLGEALAGIKEAANFAYNLNLSSQALDVNAQELSVWGSAVKQTGGTIQGFQESLRTLSTNFGLLPRATIAYLPQLAEAFQKMGRFASMRYGRMLGIDDATILLLQKGRTEVEAIVKKQYELGVATQHQIDIANKFTIALQNSGTAWRETFLSAGEKILPNITNILDKFTEFAEYLQKHLNLITGALIGIGVAAAVAVTPFILMNITVIALTVSVGLLIAAFALLYDDFEAFTHGQDSVIGRLLERWPLLGKVAVKAIEAWKMAVHDLVDSMFPLLKAIEDIYKAFSGNKRLRAFLDLKTENKPLEEKNKINSEDDSLKTNLSKAKASLFLATTTPLAAQTTSGILNNKNSNRQNIVNIGDITINTQATDAEGISTSLSDFIKNHVSGHFWQANSQFDDGVAG